MTVSLASEHHEVRLPVATDRNRCAVVTQFSMPAVAVFARAVDDAAAAARGRSWSSVTSSLGSCNRKSSRRWCPVGGAVAQTPGVLRDDRGHLIVTTPGSCGWSAGEDIARCWPRRRWIPLTVRPSMRCTVAVSATSHLLIESPRCRSPACRLSPSGRHVAVVGAAVGVDACCRATSLRREIPRRCLPLGDVQMRPAPQRRVVAVFALQSRCSSMIVTPAFRRRPMPIRAAS